MTENNISVVDRVRLAVSSSLGALVVMLLAGCVDSPPWGGWSQTPTKQEIAAVLLGPTTYIYISNYEIYHNPGRGEYTFWDGQKWMTSKEPPPEASAELLRASPGVELELADHPAKTHAAVVRRYPRDWHSPDSFVAATQ